MNPITNIKNQNKLNERELNMGYSGDMGKSWHQKYSDSAWIYIGGLPFDLSEGDIITVFSQYGEVMNINLLRDIKTGKSRGFCFLCYKDQRSTVLAVDNFNGITILRRMIRVDHVEEYKVPKYKEDADEETKRLWEEGCAPKPITRNRPDEREGRRKDDIKPATKEDILVPIREKDEGLQEVRKRKKELEKAERKAARKAKKEKKKLKKLLKKAKEDPEGDWKEQAKLYEKKVKEEDIYGENEHFNFGKKKDDAAAPTHNIRPDFEKADWRDIEIWKEIREREKAEQAAKGEVKKAWEEGEDYVSSRYK